MHIFLWPLGIVSFAIGFIFVFSNSEAKRVKWHKEFAGSF